MNSSLVDPVTKESTQEFGKQRLINDDRRTATSESVGREQMKTFEGSVVLSVLLFISDINHF